MTYRQARTEDEKAEARAASIQITQELMTQVDERIKTLSEQLAGGHSAELLNFMQFTARFHTYSLNNQLLIWMQAPEAAFVAGYHDWKALGRHVKQGAKAVRILAPITVLDREAAPNAEGKRPFKVVGFKYVSVFADFDTDGEPLPTSAFMVVQGGDQAHRDLLSQLSHAATVPVKWEDDPQSAAHGWTDGQRIILNTPKCAEQPAHALRVFFHEWAHVLLHFTDAGKRPEDLPDRKTRELEADAAAYVLCSFHGIEAEAATGDYITSWGGNPEKLQTSLHRIARAVQGVMNAIHTQPQSPALAA